MRAGQLRHRVTIQRPTEDINGGATTWSDVETVWASIAPIAGREYFAAQQVQSDVTHRVRMRYGPTVTTKDRLTFGVRHFDIRTVLNRDERNRELELLCIERT